MQYLGLMKCILLLCLLFCGALVQAQDFQKFVSSFPVRKQFMPPYKFDSTYWVGCETKMRTKKLARMPYKLLQQFIYADTANTNTTALFQAEMPTAQDYAKSTSISFYFLERIELIRDITSLLVYYSNEALGNTGNVNKSVFLLNYDKQDKLVSATKLIDYQTFVDTRIFTATIDGNYTLTQIETSYMPLDNTRLHNEINFRRYYYFKLKLEGGTFYSVQAQYFPYGGLFRAEKGQHEIKIEQNYDMFYVTESEGDGFNGLQLASYNTEKHTFTATHEASNGVWFGEFSEDKNTLTITKAEGKTIYQRVKE